MCFPSELFVSVANRLKLVFGSCGVKYLYGIMPPMITSVCPDRKGWFANVVPSFEVKNTSGLNT